MLAFILCMTITMQMLVTWILILYVLSIAVVDLTTHRIPNWLSGMAGILALLFQTLLFGFSGLLDVLLGCLVGFSMFFSFYVWKAFGAGDVKAMAVIGMFLGPKGALLASLATLIAGSVIGLFYLWRFSGSVQKTWHRFLGIVQSPFVVINKGLTVPVMFNVFNLPSKPQNKFPYGVSIAVGTLLTIWYTGAMPYLY